MSAIDTAPAEPRFWKEDTLTLDIEPPRAVEEEFVTPDHYEILRLGPQADEETIERVYSTLAGRFHPATPSTGDPETFLRVREAYETLSNPAKRAEYNILQQCTRGAARFQLRGREFFEGVVGEQNRRLAALCLLYRKRISAHESPGLTLLDLEQLTGCTREELTSALWYLCEKRWAKFGDSTEYSITADGFDVVENKMEERLEFRALATVCYYEASHGDIEGFADQHTLGPAPPPPEQPYFELSASDDALNYDGSPMPVFDIFKKLGEDRARMDALGITENEMMKFYTACGEEGEQRDEAFAALVKRFALSPAEAAFVGDVLSNCAPF